MAVIMVKVPSTKIEDLCEDVEKGLRYMGKAMQCLDAIKKEQMGERMGNREGGMGMRDYGYRFPMSEREGMEHREYPVDDREYMGERRRNSMGRYY